MSRLRPRAKWFAPSAEDTPTSGMPVPKTQLALIATIVGMVWVLSVPALPAPRAADPNEVQFSDPSPRIELNSALKPYHAAASFETDGSRWQIMTVANQLPRSVTRILVAEEPPDAALRVFPLRARPAIRQVASSDPDVIAEPAQAYGRHAFRVVVPASRTLALALRLTDADEHALVAAWSEGALAQHNRQLAVFFAAVAGLIAAALAITTGLAVMTGHGAPRWGAFTLLGVFLSRLAASGVFDSIGAADIGGPYGLTAMLAGMSLAAGVCLADTVAPLSFVIRSGAAWRTRVAVLIVAVSLCAFLGIPGAMLATEILVVTGSAAIVAYLVLCGRTGNQAARVAAPAATVFALVAAAGAAVALGALANSPAAPGVIGGFAAAGAVLLALAIAAGEGIAILPARRSTPAPLKPLPISFPAQPDLASQAISAAHQGVFDYDIENGCVRLSLEAAALLSLGSKSSVFSAEEWLARIHPDDRDVYASAMDDYRAHPGLAFRIEFRAADARGNYPWLELRSTMIGEGTRAHRCLGLISDITVRKESEAKSPAGAARERLPSRSALMEELSRLWPQAGNFTLAVVDIDRFKAIHASLGDDGGDYVLTDFAVTLGKAFGDAKVFRIGGDSFALAFDGVETQADTFAATLNETLKTPLRCDGRDVYLSASAGLARSRDATGPSDVMAHAELALAEAKRRGGGTAECFAPDDSQDPGVDSVALEAELRQALANNELEVVFQPIMRLSDGAVAGFEALLRWKHPVRGLVGPSGFIGHSELSGSIIELGKFALQQAAAELGLWQKYFPVEPPLTVNVNLSRRQLQDSEYENLLVGVLSEAGLEPGTLKLELTESAVSEINDAGQRLTRLKAAGAGLAIDDFGTGLSALSQLKVLPFDTLKIDKSFLVQRETTDDGNDSSILRSIVRLAHELELSVVAEGVETARDAQWLKDIGCEYGQGYYFSPALPRGDVLAFIARHHANVPVIAEGAGTSGVTGVRG